MPLNDLDFSLLQERVRLASIRDKESIDAQRVLALDIGKGLQPIEPASDNAIAVVSADGGSTSFSFNPAGISFIRVADSNGTHYATDALPGSVSVGELSKQLSRKDQEVVHPALYLCEAMGLELFQLSDILCNLGKSKGGKRAIHSLREISEWGVLLYVLENQAPQWKTDNVYVFDGLLRSKAFNSGVFADLSRKIREAAENASVSSGQKVFVVGVAKTSAVLSKLSLALLLERTFEKDYPCYASVSRAVEAEIYNFNSKWLSNDPDDTSPIQETQAMGKMHLVKFGDRALDPVWPVDVAEFQLEAVAEALGMLVADAQLGFPVPDYPMSLQKAHEYAALSGFESQMLRELFLDGICSTLETEDDVERMSRYARLRENLAQRRYE